MLIEKLKKLWQGEISLSEVFNSIRSELPKKLKKLLRGEMSLFDAFWIYSVGLKLIITICLNLSLKFIVKISITWINHTFLITFITLSYIFILCTYNVIALTGVWRSSNNYNGNMAWEVLAKLYAIIVACQVYSNISDIPQDFTEMISLLYNTQK